jgi:hypothetical protein
MINGHEQTHSARINFPCAAAIGAAGSKRGRPVKRPITVALLALSLVAGVVATAALVGTSSGAVAQDAVSAAMDTHPIVGAWLLTLDVNDPADPPHLVIYHGDGTYTDAGPGRGGGVGVWDVIDPNTVATNVLFHTEDENGDFGMTRIRTVTTVDESGDTYTTEYTREVIAPDGTSTGELGPGTGTAERHTVEPRGTPTAPMT